MHTYAHPHTAPEPEPLSKLLLSATLEVSPETLYELMFADDCEGLRSLQERLEYFSMSVVFLSF